MVSDFTEQTRSGSSTLQVLPLPKGMELQTRAINIRNQVMGRPNKAMGHLLEKMAHHLQLMDIQDMVLLSKGMDHLKGKVMVPLLTR